MKTRILLSSFLVLFLISFSVMAQKPDPLSYIKKAELKSDVVGSYPTEIWKYSWIVEYWSIHEKTTIVYTDFGAVAEITVVGEDGNLHTTYTYNQDHTISEIVIQKKEGEVWVNDRRERIEYNEMGHPTSIITESWFDSEWMMSVGYQNTYTMSDEQIVGILGKLWSRDDQDWINSTRQSISFSQDLSVTESIMEIWENGAWKNTSFTRTTMLDGRVSEIIMSGWLDEAWVASSKMVYEYGDNESYVFTSFTGSGDGNWTPDQRIVENFDSFGNRTLRTFEQFISEWMFFNGSESLLTYEGSNLIERITRTSTLAEPGIWKNYTKEEFKDFASLSTSNIIVGNESIQHYPNPAKESVNLRISNLSGKSLKITLMNLEGKAHQMDNVYVPGDEFMHILDLKKLPAGVYILQARDEAGKLISSSRLIHQK